MNSWNLKAAGIAFVLVGVFTSVSCTEEKKPEATVAKPQAVASSSDGGVTTVSLKPGEAGGVIEDSFSVTVSVSAVEKASRKITLSAADGTKTTFTAGPEIRNFDQLAVGDKVTATISERLTIFVRSGSEDPAVSHAAGLAAAPKGAKPGAMVAEAYEITANVAAIDTAKRTAALLFADGKLRTVSIRPDVDLTRYKAGDTVVIRVTDSLSVLAEKP